MVLGLSGKLTIKIEMHPLISDLIDKNFLIRP